MKISPELEGMLKKAGYSGLPAYFSARDSEGRVYDRDPRFTQRLLDEAEPEQIMAIIDALERAPWPANAKVIWARDDEAKIVKDFAA